jgi:D-alanyl-D-alanine carboxypeptidase
VLYPSYSKILKPYESLRCNLSKSSVSLPAFLTALFIAAMLPLTGYAAQPKKSEEPVKKSIRKVTAQKTVIKPRIIPHIVQAKAFFCMDEARNTVVMSKNADQSLPVASLTKLVTAMVALENMKLSQKVTIPSDIKTVPKSVVGLKPGDQVSVEDLLHGLLIGSGNDCAEALAASFRGGKTKFVTAMNKKVNLLGATHTIFYTPSGLDRKIASEGDSDSTQEVDSNVSTAREMALIAKEAFSSDTIRSISHKKSYVMGGCLAKNGYSVRTTNKLLHGNLPIVGAKTGFTVRAGHCLASKFSAEGNSLLIVVLGSPNHFKDTRLVYQKVIKQLSKTKPPAIPSKRIATNPR